MIQLVYMLVPILFATPVFCHENDKNSVKESAAFEECTDTSIAESSISDESTESSIYDSSCSSSSSNDDISIDGTYVDEATQAVLCNLIGPSVKKDELSITVTMPSQESLALPKNLEHNIVMDLPVGFYRLRRAFLSSQSTFWTKSILRDTLSYGKIDTTPWDRCEAHIGHPDHPDHIDPTKFLGATRNTTYLMPAGKLVPANMAFETATIVDYNDNFFAIQMNTSTPDVPFGKTFLARTQIVVVNTGKNTCQMICSVETEFPNGPPFGVTGQIKNGMKKGTMEMFKKISSHIENHDVSQGRC